MYGAILGDIIGSLDFIPQLIQFECTGCENITEKDECPGDTSRAFLYIEIRQLENHDPFPGVFAGEQLIEQLPAEISPLFNHQFFDLNPFDLTRGQISKSKEAHCNDGNGNKERNRGKPGIEAADAQQPEHHGQHRLSTEPKLISSKMMW